MNTLKVRVGTEQQRKGESCWGQLEGGEAEKGPRGREWEVGGGRAVAIRSPRRRREAQWELLTGGASSSV